MRPGPPRPSQASGRCCFPPDPACTCACSDQWRNYGAERYGPDSVCLSQRSAFVMEQCTRKMTYPDWGAGCYKVPLMLAASMCAPPPTHLGPVVQVSCTGQGLLVTVQDRSFLCVHEGQLLSVSVRVSDWVYNGVLLCPACHHFCPGCPPPRQPPPTNASSRTPIGQCRPTSDSVSRRRCHSRMMTLCVADPCSGSPAPVPSLLPLLAAPLLCSCC